MFGSLRSHCSIRRAGRHCIAFGNRPSPPSSDTAGGSAALALAIVSAAASYHQLSNDSSFVTTTQLDSSSSSSGLSPEDPTDQPERLARMAPRIPVRTFDYNPHLQIAFDTRTRNPVYVLERLVVANEDDDPNTNKNKKPVQRRRPRFFVEPNLPEEFQSRNAHYQGSGYDRGHMAPAADFHWTDSNNHGSTNDDDDDLFQQTFCLTNTCPQDSQLNRTLWAQLEDWTRRVAQHYHDLYNNNNKKNAKQGHSTNQVATYAVTGPLWLPKRQLAAHKFQYQYPALGQPPELVAVPTHLFKIVLVVRHHRHHPNRDDDDIVAFACFVIPNEAPPAKPKDKKNNKNNDNNTLSRYLVCWTDLEAVTGLEFFANLLLSQHNKNNNKKLSPSSWKTLANDLTLREMQGEPLLLPDGKRNKAFRWGSNPRHPSLVHLCSKGNCDLSRRVFH